MLQKKSILLIITAFASTILFGQSKYYKKTNGKIIDSLEYSILKRKTIERNQASFNQRNPDPLITTEYTISENLREEYKNKDSIIYAYTWTMKSFMRENVDVKGVGVNKYYNKEFPLPNFKTLDNKTIGINDLKGKPTLINFWFTTCIPCIEEMPVLNKIKDKFKDSVNFIAISYEDSKKVREFLLNHAYNFIQIADAEKFTNSLEMTSFPLNLFLDKDGKVVSVQAGIPYIEDNNKKAAIGDGNAFEEILRKLL
jgi:thiol-disulfide isomerase/thioredoxin